MASIAEVLKQTGFTDEQISSLDPKLITVFTGIQTSAEQAKADATAAAQKAETDRLAWEKAKADAELLNRSNTEFYETKIVPGLTSWQEEQVKLQADIANANALAAFYKAQNEGARSAGFVPTDAPTFTTPTTPATPPRSPNGQFVPNAPGTTPGSPTFTMDQIDQRLGNGVSNIGWAMQEYQRLTGGQFLPDPFDQLAKEADAQKLPFRDYVARKYNFAQKQQDIVQRQQQEHDAKVAADAKATAESEWKQKLDAREAEYAAKEKLRAEQGGNNPDVRVAVSSRIPELQRKVETKEMPDPLMMNENQRRAQTAKMIRDTISQKDAAAA
jgi:hypothetical protein